RTFLHCVPKAKQSRKQCDVSLRPYYQSWIASGKALAMTFTNAESLSVRTSRSNPDPRALRHCEPKVKHSRKQCDDRIRSYLQSWIASDKTLSMTYTKANKKSA